jgi:hypothetical protein
MKLPSFCIVMALALILAILAWVESTEYQAWNQSLAEHQKLETGLVQAEHFDAITQGLLQRIGNDSRRDPALVEILDKHGIRVVENPPRLPGNPANASTPALSPSSPPSPTP